MSIAPGALVKMERVWAMVSVGLAERNNAAIAAACGAAAEVPKKVLKPGAAQLTPSAAVRSGFCASAPPVDEKFPGVIGVLSGLKKWRRGPSELKVSTTVLPLNNTGGRCASAAATPNPPKAAACPPV